MVAADAGKAAVRVERADVDVGVLLFEPDALFAAGVAALAECLVAQQAAAVGELGREGFAVDDVQHADDECEGDAGTGKAQARDAGGADDGDFVLRRELAESHDGADEDGGGGVKQQFFRQDEEQLQEEDGEGVVALAEVVGIDRDLYDVIDGKEESERNEASGEDGAQQVAVKAGHARLRVWRQRMRMRASTAPCSQ